MAHRTIGQPRHGSDKFVLARLSAGQAPKNRSDKLDPVRTFGQLEQSRVELPTDESYNKQLVPLVGTDIGIFGGLGNKLNFSIA